ncbi:adenylate isopentenyltransferase [Cornus florida]|uniref:adenylate isopentenyltransferase n=1 Tax=Cornus florida TaxID=4283 RepID=UPI0028A1AFB0|nr:adenylate isopentenyltransferase [Cornus florida]
MRLSPFPNTHHHYCSTKLISLNHHTTAVKSSSSAHAALKIKWAQMDTTNNNHSHHRRHISNEKVVVILGPTGSGKSRLSIDLATRFFPSEVINSDKIQVYRGLDITTNKIPMRQRLGVPHHLLGEIDPDEPELTPSEFRSLAASTISDIASRRNLPLVVGGSNSFIYALVSNRFDPDSDMFDDSRTTDSICTDLRYDCCFLWVDVSLPVLNQYLTERVDDMLVSGMFDELAEFFESDESGNETRTGLRKAIGVPEFERYFKKLRPEEDVRVKRVVYDEAVRAIKDNTCQLAKRQVGKIQRLRDAAGWKLRRLDATEAFRTAMGVGGSDSGRWSDIWERQVVEPSVKIVRRFLEG